MSDPVQPARKVRKVGIAIVGSGPGGLSAAARAAELGISHILLESAPQLSNTVYRYQRGKHVMAEPSLLPLRSSLAFAAGTRESILESWQQGVERLGVKLRCGAEVAEITGERDNFVLRLSDGRRVFARRVVLGIGLQGNLRRLQIPGDDLPGVQYQLDDPKEYAGEAIVVVGAGDAAVENALALAADNSVTLINRSEEFTRAKEGNLNAVLAAIKAGQLNCLYSATSVAVRAVDPAQNNGRPLLFTVSTPDGEAELSCDRIIARLGAIPPRRFVESCGVAFPSADPAAVPAVSEQYESNVPGLYIVGALAGYPLIKQAMNQGYEVVEYILGRKVEPADEPLLRERFGGIPGFRKVSRILREIQSNIPLFDGITTLQLREFLLDSRIRTPAPGEVLFEVNDYTDTFFSILRGSVQIQIGAGEERRQVNLGVGEFFGEMSLISGRRRSATVTAGKDCVLIETPRRSMNKLISSSESVKRRVDEVSLKRTVHAQIGPYLSDADLDGLVAGATVCRYAAGEALFNEGDPGDSLHVIRRGSVTVSRRIGERDVVLAYLPAGSQVGEMALLTDSERSATVRATVASETIRLDADAFKAVMARHPRLLQAMRSESQSRLARSAQRQVEEADGGVIEFLVQQGMGEATDVLLIDESLCVRCDNCEKACADTHGGASRLDRDAGPTFASIHVPTSCRHCEHPHCMKECPPDAIHRSPQGEVYIEDNCIGCGNCERNCPYGVIRMAYEGPRKPRGLLGWLLFGRGAAPGAAYAGGSDAIKKATKCDMCNDLPGGPACVRACPTGAALRASPETFMDLTRGAGARRTG